ncbi:hypothetical protein V757_02915 [Pelistega indica]|uniref:Uncharacterized protein n=1 Tax=Pelistega indica TaxID=1414851 RepID=V8G7Z6_9BURK|nr:hypothetical protein [Pelistega indica]ETD72659.1 hypothetical protein V757_02915 [Pelistega indica]
MKLFHPQSTSAISGIFTVSLGEVAIISSYNLHDNQRGVIQKVWFKDGKVPTGGSCNVVLETEEAHILAVEDVTQCGVWAVNPCQNIALLSIPGNYRMVLDDGYATKEVAPDTPVPVAESTAVGVAMIEVTKVPIAYAEAFPKDLFFGAVTGCHGCN